MDDNSESGFSSLWYVVWKEDGTPQYRDWINWTILGHLCFTMRWNGNYGWQSQPENAACGC